MNLWAGWLLPVLLACGLTHTFSWWFSKSKTSRMASLTCLVFDADTWLGCLHSLSHSPSPSSKLDWVLPRKFQRNTQEGKGRSCKIFWGRGSDFIHCHFCQSKSQDQCRFKEWKIESTPGSLVINLPILQLIIPFYNQVPSFSLCSFHYDIYNLRIKSRQVLESEDT